MSLTTTKFQENMLSGCRGVALTNCFSSIFHFGQISKLKKGVTSREKNGIKICCRYAHLHIMSFITTKFHGILLSGFRGVELTRKTELTDWLTDRPKTLHPLQLVAWGIIIGFQKEPTHVALIQLRYSVISMVSGLIHVPCRSADVCAATWKHQG